MVLKATDVASTASSSACAAESGEITRATAAIAELNLNIFFITSSFLFTYQSHYKQLPVVILVTEKKLSVLYV
jgi:hypothetical protein